MKEKLEAKLEDLKKVRQNYLTELEKIDKAKSTATSQVIACNGAIQTLEALLTEEVPKETPKEGGK